MQFTEPLQPRYSAASWLRVETCQLHGYERVSQAGDPPLDPTTFADGSSGLHIYQGGIALQQVFIFVFLALSVQFQRTLAKETPSNKTTQAMRLLYTMYAVLALITVSPRQPTIQIPSLSNPTDTVTSYASSSASPSTPKASTVPSQAMRHTNTVWTLCPCLSPSSCSISYIPGRLCRARRATSQAGRRGSKRALG